MIGKENKIQEIFGGSLEIIEKDSLQKKLESGKKLRIKYGVDPTGAHLHLGHAVILEKLRQFQELDHIIVLLIGNFTARFGDPTDQVRPRTLISSREVDKFIPTYLEEAGIILKMDKTEVRFNFDWYKKMPAEEILKLMSYFTLANLIERDMFEKRLREKVEIRLNEIVYPVLQAYDSVMIKSDLTVVGSDQKFNELQARYLQKVSKQSPQDLMLMPVLVGTDGKNKMSMTLNNWIGIKEEPVEQFGKLMSIPDDLILSYFKLLVRKTLKEKQDFEKKLKATSNPRALKEEMAFKVVSQLHSKKEAEFAQNEFKKVFKLKQTPSKIPIVKLEGAKFTSVTLLMKTGLAKSRSEARRLINQGGVKINGKKITSPDKPLKVTSGEIVQVGKRHFVKIKIV